MRAASRIFRWAGIYGLVVLLPMFLLEARFGRDYPPPLNHAEFYYGFNALALVWQLAFLVIASDPVRFRPLMIVAVLEKLGWGLVAFGLAAVGRPVPQASLALAAVDLGLGAAFLYARRRTPVGAARA